MAEPMKSFAQNFFTHFNARIEPQAHEWVVDLPPELAEVFGKPRLYLVFPGEEGTMRQLSPHEDLLTYGSRTFDHMLALLAERGEIAHIQLPPRFSEQPDQLPASLSLGNCQMLSCQGRSALSPFYFFNFRAIYRSTEKQEELLTVVLDAGGVPRPDLVNIFAGADNLSTPHPPPAIKPDALQNLLAKANDVARDQVQSRAAEIETTIAPRLEKTLLRLTTYYRRLTDEVNTGDAEKDDSIRAGLQNELTQQIADELQRHRLRITLQPISYAVVQLPFTDYQITLATPHSEQTLNFCQNLYTGTIEGLTCHHCGEALAQISLCDRGHVAHTHCLDTCHRCERDICHTCGIEPCDLCHQPVCVDCIATCRYCERRLCAAHVQTCAVCRASFCTEHAYHCQMCGQTYCQQCRQGKTCHTCRAALDGTATGPITLPAGVNIAGVQPDRYQWQTSQNSMFTVYLGRRKSGLAVWQDHIVLVVNQGGQLVYRQNIGLFRRLWGKFK